MKLCKDCAHRIEGVEARCDKKKKRKMDLMSGKEYIVGAHTCFLERYPEAMRHSGQGMCGKEAKDFKPK